MAKQFTDNPTKTPAAPEDVIPFRDVTTNSDKKTTISGLAPAIASSFAASSVPVASLSGVAWQAYVPTISGFSVGNATVRARFWKVGKFVSVKVFVTSGSTSSTNNPIVLSSPTTSALYGVAEVMGFGKYKQFHGPVVWNDASTVTLRWYQVSGSGLIEAAITSSSPDSLGGAGQVWMASWSYEEA